MKNLISSIAIITLTGCSSLDSKPPVQEIIIGQAIEVKDESPGYKHADAELKLVNTERYTRVSQEPLPEQLDLLSVTISTKIPSSLKTVKQAIDFLLMRSGYVLLDLSEQSTATKIMMGNNIPDAHRQIQMMPLRSALSMLAGKAFELRENDVYRTVMYINKEGQ